MSFRKGKFSVGYNRHENPEGYGVRAVPERNIASGVMDEREKQHAVRAWRKDPLGTVRRHGRSALGEQTDPGV